MREQVHFRFVKKIIVWFLCTNVLGNDDDCEQYYKKHREQ